MSSCHQMCKNKSDNNTTILQLFIRIDTHRSLEQHCENCALYLIHGECGWKGKHANVVGQLIPGANSGNTALIIYLPIMLIRVTSPVKFQAKIEIQHVVKNITYDIIYIIYNNI